MCGRYSITKPIDAVRYVFEAQSTLNFPPRYNVAPTRDVPFVRLSADGSRELAMLRWGLIPRWARDTSIGSKLINARSDTVAEKPSYRDALKKRRSLIVADGFYEWQTTDGVKQPWRITLASDEPFGFAGLWESWTSPEGPVIESTAIITTDANKALHPIHHRMPVIVDPHDYDTWLDPAAKADALQVLLRPYPDELVHAYKVSRVVNNVRNGGPDRVVESVTEFAKPFAKRDRFNVRLWRHLRLYCRAWSRSGIDPSRTLGS